MPGRPKKPILIHRIEGTERKHRTKSRGDELVLSGAPEAPDWLWPEAREEWDRLLKNSRYAAALASVDRGMMAAYCQLWARFVKGEREDKPLGGRQLQTLVAIAAKLGLNPTDRTKVRAPQEKDKADEPWEKLGA